MDIYEQIWNADMQNGNGIKAVIDEKDGNVNDGYVVVNELKNGPADTRLFTKVHIPESKMKTYDLCMKLFNNYCLSPSQNEINTLEEDAEVHELIEAMLDTPPMRIAQQWVFEQTGQAQTPFAFYNLLMKIWFEQYTQSSGKDLSAFEHVIVGEQKNGKVSGYHFWYKYYLDDSNDLLDRDTIEYKGLAGSHINQNILVPEVSTLSYSWEAYDYHNQAYRPLFKKIGGFFNGCSIECLMALGTVRFMATAPKMATINGSNYEMKLYRSNDEQHMRTFYPVFKGNINQADTDIEPVIIINDDEHHLNKQWQVKIIAALVNPKGPDEGKEVVTLFNPSPNTLSVKDWVISDRNANKYQLEEGVIQPGEALAVHLPKNTAQLSNKGGLIRLIDGFGNPIDEVHYSKAQAKKNQGWMLMF